MTPRLVTPPSLPVVSLSEMKAHLRVTALSEDALISSLVAAATAHFDGWKGVLGRCVMPQTWVVFALAGDVTLPLPDVISATFDAVALDITETFCGSVVTIPSDGDVTFTCAMGAGQLPAMQMAVKLLAAHWFENRSAVGAEGVELPLSVAALTGAMRWEHI